MLRSGARSPLVRFLGHAFAVASALLFGWAFFIAIWSAFTVDPVGIRVWILGSAAMCYLFVAAATIYVMRRPHSGGYFLVALACLVATVVCVVSLFPLLWVQT